MRICVLTPTFLPGLGGVEVAIDNLVREWRGLGHEAAVLAPRRRRLPAPEGGYTYPVRHHHRLLSLKGRMSGVRRALGRWHREVGFDVVNAQMAYPAGYAACLWGRDHDVAVVVSCQGGDVSRRSRFRDRPLIMERLHWCLNAADAVTAVSADLAAEAAAISGGREAVLVPNGVDAALAEPVSLTPSVPWDAGGPFLLYMKRLHPWKGHETLLQAYAKVAGHGTPPLVLAGCGPEEMRLRLRVRELRLEGCVHLLGGVEGELRRWLLQHCLAFVHPSGREGLPLVVLEAMICGRPVLGARCEGMTTLVEDGREGWLVEPDQPEALARALGELLQSPDLQERGEAARRKAAGFLWPRVARRYLEVFRTVRRVPS